MTGTGTGTPCWADLGTSDPEAARAFYGALFGWAATEPDEKFGGYAQWHLGGQPAGGVGPLMNPAQPVAWSMYLRTEDADVTAAAVKEAGGQVLFDPETVGDLGRFTVLVDPQGAAFGVWQPLAFAGFGRTGEPGTFAWMDLASPDIPASKAFYGTVFGWSASEGDYVHVSKDGTEFGGIMDMTGYPEGVPPHWMVYFGTADVDASVAKVLSLGGAQHVPPAPIPGGGRFAIVTDPQGAAFALYEKR
ncbi:VOC family protein [Longispora albida]|uniref:VOC family protein n=1 Tax=Longispora albida TaxID=203523 RepID=UPI00037D573A|nr:VOC family protein [Longispora albida]